jgi:hypothetical protein
MIRESFSFQQIFPTCEYVSLTTINGVSGRGGSCLHNRYRAVFCAAVSVFPDRLPPIATATFAREFKKPVCWSYSSGQSGRGWNL